MSRIRYVKGKIFKRTEGMHQLYAGENIVFNSGAEIAESGVEKGVSFNMPKDPLPQEIVTKCMVQFRPHGNWVGEYGFDWFRGGDSGLNTDPNWFGKIVGKHFTDQSYTNVFPDTNSWSVYFKQNWKMYDRILRSYRNYSIPWKEKIRGNTYLYPVPILTMLEGEKHTFTLKIEIEELPKTLKIRQRKLNQQGEDYFSFNKNDIPIKKGKYSLENFLVITCKKSFKNDQTIEIVADNNKICGWLTIKANHVSTHRHIPIVVIPVKTKINTTVIGNMVPGAVNFFKQGLKQAYVFPSKNNIEYLPDKFLDLTSNNLFGLLDNEFKKEYCNATGVARSSGLISKKPMLKFLDEELEKKYPGKYTNHYKLYFIGIPFNITKNGMQFIIQGFSNFRTLHGVYFKGHDRSTVIHETLHAMGLPHTFDGISPEAIYTYKAQQTDNYMDYCHWNVDIQGNPRKAVEGRTLFYWQMKALNPKF